MNSTLVQIVAITATFILFILMMALMTKYRGVHPVNQIEKWKYFAFAMPGIATVLLVAVLFRDNLGIGMGRTLLLNSVLWAIEVWFILYTLNIGRMSIKV